MIFDPASSLLLQRSQVAKLRAFCVFTCVVWAVFAPQRSQAALWQFDLPSDPGGGDPDIHWSAIHMSYNSGNQALSGNFTVTSTNASDVPEMVSMVVSNGSTPSNSNGNVGIMMLDPAKGYVQVYSYNFDPTDAGAGPNDDHDLSALGPSIYAGGTLSVSATGNNRTFTFTLPCATVNTALAEGVRFGDHIGLWLRAYGNDTPPEYNSAPPYPHRYYTGQFLSGWNPNWDQGGSANGMGFFDVGSAPSSGGCAAFIFAPSVQNLASASIGVSYSTTLTVSNGLAPFTWTVASGALPPGLTLTSGGTISGGAYCGWLIYF